METKQITSELNQKQTRNIERYYPSDVLAMAYAKALQINKDFVIDKQSEKLFNTLSLYFANDPKFESDGHGSLTKGLLLCGGIGTGKTFLLKCFSENPKTESNRYSIHPTSRLSFLYQSQGVEHLEIYFGPKYGQGYSYGAVRVFDDLGTEPLNSKFMGNEINVMEQIILQRYESMPHYYTHFTTNLNQAQIEEAYGKRVLSRLREMCNIIKVVGDDRRK